MSEMERLVNLLHLEREAHAKTRRKLEKAEHDRDRYARRIAMMRAQSKAENAAAN